MDTATVISIVALLTASVSALILGIHLLTRSRRDRLAGDRLDSRIYTIIIRMDDDDKTYR